MTHMFLSAEPRVDNDSVIAGAGSEGITLLVERGFRLITYSVFKFHPVQVPNGPGIYLAFLKGGAEFLKEFKANADRFQLGPYCLIYSGKTNDLQSQLAAHFRGERDKSRFSPFLSCSSYDCGRNEIYFDKTDKVMATTTGAELGTHFRRDGLMAYKAIGSFEDTEAAFLSGSTYLSKGQNEKAARVRSPDGQPRPAAGASKAEMRASGLTLGHTATPPVAAHAVNVPITGHTHMRADPVAGASKHGHLLGWGLATSDLRPHSASRRFLRVGALSTDVPSPSGRQP